MSLQETGWTAVATGAGVCALGAVVLFDRALVAAGNLLVLAGLALLLRPHGRQCLRRERLPGTALFLAGVLALVLRCTVLGLLCEAAGLLCLAWAARPPLRALAMRALLGRRAA